MSKVKLLLDVVEDMRSLADSIQSIADSIQGNTAESEMTTQQSDTIPPQKHTLPEITIDQVRTLLAEKSGEGKTQAVKALLYGDQTHTALIDAVANDDGQPELPDEPAPDEPALVDMTVVIVSEGGKVNVRCGNGTEYERLSTVAPGSTFPLVATAQNEWYAIVIGSRVGWVSGKFAKVI